MADKKRPADQQVDTIDRSSPFIQESFDLDRMDSFVSGLGVQYLHYKAIVSPIGKKDRGDYRRSDGVDTITSNGMIYKLAGKFTATMTDNSRNDKRGDAGILDVSEGRLVMPRFYDTETGTANGARIYLAPGDRIYVCDPEADVLVSNFHEMDYEFGIDNQSVFPISKLELPIIDSQNIEYKEGVDFTITSNGDVRWIDGQKNPGIDPTTGKGRIYSIRYLYKAFWYITVIPKEVRVTNVTTNGERKPERMPYHPVVVREYIYHNQNRADKTAQLKSKDPKRADKAPVQSTAPDKFVIPVDISAIGEDDGQS